jgi:hypothetical protein
MAEELIKWEYRVRSFGSMWSAPKPDEMELVLQEWGTDGWEVVSAFNSESSNKVTLIAKRPLTREISRSRSMP